MAAFLVTLPVPELQSLRRLANGKPWPFISKSHGATLIRKGFARANAGVLTITTLGRAKLVVELTRASWDAVAV